MSPAGSQRRTRWNLATATAVVALAMAATVSPGSAAASPGAGSRSVPTGNMFGYVWADQPTAASYTPSSQYQKNSTGATNTVVRTGVGAYEVRFPNLGVAQGTVDVTTYGGDGYYCKVLSWGPDGTTQVVRVRCFNEIGHRVNAFYDVAYVRTVGMQSTLFGYVLADRPGAASYTPARATQYNSKGLTNTVKHPSTGNYVVKLPGLEAAGGTVKVSAFGSASFRCKVVSWHQNTGGTAELVRVHCFGVGGPAFDSAFTMTFANDRSLLGVNGASSYVWANQPANPSYTPNSTYAFDSAGGTITITRSARGTYEVHMPGLGRNNGDVQVTAYGSTPIICQVQGWGASGSTLVIGVLCFNSEVAWVKADARYTVQYLR